MEHHPEACPALLCDVVSLTVRDSISDGLRPKIGARDKYLGSKLTTGLLISGNRCRGQTLRLRLRYPRKVDTPCGSKPPLSLSFRMIARRAVALSRLIAS
jgi:hypothetical protein